MAVGDIWIYLKVDREENGYINEMILQNTRTKEIKKLSKKELEKRNQIYKFSDNNIIDYNMYEICEHGVTSGRYFPGWH